MAAWVAAGQALRDFWDATPRELAAAIAGETQRIEAQRDIAVIGGWIAAIETRSAKIHPLDELLAKFRPKGPSKPWTNEQMATAWNTFAQACPGMVKATFVPLEEADAALRDAAEGGSSG